MLTWSPVKCEKRRTTGGRVGGGARGSARGSWWGRVVTAVAELDRQWRREEGGRGVHVPWALLPFSCARWRFARLFLSCSRAVDHVVTVARQPRTPARAKARRPRHAPSQICSRTGQSRARGSCGRGRRTARRCARGRRPSCPRASDGGGRQQPCPRRATGEGGEDGPLVGRIALVVGSRACRFGPGRAVRQVSLRMEGTAWRPKAGTTATAAQPLGPSTSLWDPAVLKVRPAGQRRRTCRVDLDLEPTRLGFSCKDGLGHRCASSSSSFEREQSRRRSASEARSRRGRDKTRAPHVSGRCCRGRQRGTRAEPCLRRVVGCGWRTGSDGGGLSMVVVGGWAGARARFQGRAAAPTTTTTTASTTATTLDHTGTEDDDVPDPSDDDRVRKIWDQACCSSARV